MRTLALQAPPARRMIHYTPLRYPGGKGKLAAYIKAVMKENKLLDGEYAEPYAGGAAIGLELLFHDYVSRIHINDVSRPVFAFWESILAHTDRFTKRVHSTPLNLTNWDKQKRVFANPDDYDNFDLGFATFYLNRTNRSGILNGGIIGGRDQSGPWKIDARFNRDELIFRIESIAKLRNKINVTQLDALKFLKAGIAKWPAKTLIYLDPPYYAKGRDLYYDFYDHDDHEALAKFVTGKLVKQRWVVSYDNEPAIRKLYTGCQRLTYSLGYSARSASEGAEVMFFSDALRVPTLVGPFKVIRGAWMKKKENDEYPPAEAKRRFEAALRGSKVGHTPMKDISPKAPKKSADKARKPSPRAK